MIRDIETEAKEILGSDLNQSLHHLIGYWYAIKTSDVFDTELACAMIDLLLFEFKPHVKNKEYAKVLKENQSLKEKVEKLMECVKDFILEQDHDKACPDYFYNTGECNCMNRDYYNHESCIGRAKAILELKKEGGE